MDSQNFKDLYTQVTRDYTYIQGIILKNGKKEQEKLLIIAPDYIENKEEMVFCKRDNRNYVIGKRGGCWGLKLQNISKQMLIVRFSKDKEEIANMLLRPGQKYFMNNYNIKGKNYFEIQESESTEKTVLETLEEGTFNKHKNEYELHVFPVERLENHEDYKYGYDDFIKKEESPLIQMNDYQRFINRDSRRFFDEVNNVGDLLGQGNASREGNTSISRQKGRGRRFKDMLSGNAGGLFKKQGNASSTEQENRVGNMIQEDEIRSGNIPRENTSFGNIPTENTRFGGIQQRQGCGGFQDQGNFLEDSKHTMHKMSERKNEERLSTTDVAEQVDQCMRLQFVVIIKKTLEVNVIDDKSKLVEMLDSQLQKQWAEQVGQDNRYVQDECIVCYTDKPEKMFAKCGHGCTCQSCYKEFRRQSQRNCPLCRSVIQGVFSI